MISWPIYLQYLHIYKPNQTTWMTIKDNFHSPTGARSSSITLTWYQHSVGSLLPMTLGQNSCWEHNSIVSWLETNYLSASYIDPVNKYSQQSRDFTHKNNKKLVQVCCSKCCRREQVRLSLRKNFGWLATARQHRNVNLCQLRGKETGLVVKDGQRDTLLITLRYTITIKQCNTGHSKTHQLRLHEHNNWLSNRMTY